ncbi:epoxide hydrolase [Moniliophthora roreri]|nr:epoxide hydrolase [Moniliophthora roreri]
MPSIPAGYLFFPKEIVQGPKSWCNDLNIVFKSRHEHGGHFAAHERPAELVGNLRKMFGKCGPAYGVVPGKDGSRPFSERILTFRDGSKKLISKEAKQHEAGFPSVE